MTTLRALVGGGLLLAVIVFVVFVVFVPIVWAVVIGIGEAFPEKFAAASLTFR
jgi:hypothetical protein